MTTVTEKPDRAGPPALVAASERRIRGPFGAAVANAVDLLGLPGLMLVGFAGLALAGPVLLPDDPLLIRAGAPSVPPFRDPEFLLGTDQLGRDMLSRLVAGSRLSFILAVVPVAIGGSIGLVLGAIAGLGPRTLGTLLMRIMDVLLAFPSIVLALAVVAVRGPSFGNALLALTVVFIAPMTRVARGVAVEVASRPYIEAARLSGAGVGRIIRDFGLPNMLPPVLVYTASQCGVMLLYGAGLSFLGAGAQPPDIEWGRMVADGRVIFLITPWPSLLPGLLIFLASLGFNLLADRLRDRLDPRWGPS